VSIREKLLIGNISDFFRKPFTVAILVLQFAAVVGASVYYHSTQTSEGCLYCHADRERMAKAGYPDMYMTQAQVERESKMPGATCRDCHLGDGKSHDKNEAHEGMLRPLLIDHDSDIVNRPLHMKSLAPTGDDPLYAVFPKYEEDGKLYPDGNFFTILWQDRDPDTLGYDRSISEKTCGKTGCHPLEVEQFGKSDMGGNVRQRSMRYWTDVHGPNNCGPSFADLPADAGDVAGYSDTNYKLIARDLSCPSTYDQAKARQRFCNVCHTGCLDCHYRPDREKGVHYFSRSVEALNCSGGGRGTGVCHAGTLERRRGGSYIGGAFSQPPGMAPDAHYKAGLNCVDCHQTGIKGMGDIQRKTDCTGCHYFAAKALEGSVHKNLRCQACHVSELGGYQMTVWGKGHVGGEESPFEKYSLYYGTVENPVIIKDAEGKYAPYKAWPNMATNYRPEVPKAGGVKFRWKDGETRDAYALLGTYTGLPGANNALVWYQLESVSHPLRKSRTCGSCHDSAAQRANVTWEYVGYAGSYPFTGAQTVVGDRDGLRIEDLRTTSEMKLMEDANVYDFAAWKYIPDGFWNFPGDFSMPKADKDKYDKYLAEDKLVKARIDVMEAELKKLTEGSDEYRALKKKIKRLKDVGMHGPKEGVSMIEGD